MHRRRTALLTLLLLIGLIAIPVVLTWREVRQERLNHALVAAIDCNDTANGLLRRYVRHLLRIGADPNAEVIPIDTRPIWKRMWDLLRHRRSPRPIADASALIMAVEWQPDLGLKGDLGLIGYGDADNVDMVMTLVTAGAQINRRGGHGDWRATPLIVAVTCEKWKTVQVLLDANADVDPADHDTNTALMIAADVGNVEVMEKLLNRGAQTAVTNSANETPLLYAIRPAQQHGVATVRKMVACLIRHRANVSYHDKYGHCALAYARNWWHDKRLIQILTQAGATE
jgi:ankyrin repeat protein